MHQLKLDSPGRRKIKYCPCGKDNRDGKFIPFTDYDKFGHCHGCDKTLFPPMEKDTIVPFTQIRNPETRVKLPITIMPNDLVKRNVCEPSTANLIKWLGCESRRDRGEVPFTPDQVRDITKRYRIRGTDVYRGGVAFVYIDINSNVRQIKVMGYDAKTGKRVKEPFSQVSQIGKTILGQAGIMGANIVPCFFGEHLLAENNFEVYIFESEATAIYASAFYVDKVCIATGGKHGCRWDKPEQFKVLMGRRVILFPDIDAHDEWVIKAGILKKAGITVGVSNAIVTAVLKQSAVTGVAYDSFKALKFDLRDILVYKDPVSMRLVKPPTKLPDPDNAETTPTLKSGLEPFETITGNSGRIESPPRFDPDEYKRWFDSVGLPNYPVDIGEKWLVHNTFAFVAGRLNHIRAFTNYRDPGNRSKYIYELQQLRGVLTRC